LHCIVSSSVVYQMVPLDRRCWINCLSIGFLSIRIASRAEVVSSILNEYVFWPQWVIFQRRWSDLSIYQSMIVRSICYISSSSWP
jgi:hypothetical protein